MLGVMLQDFKRFAGRLGVFMGVALPAAGVNAGLKYMQKRIQIAFMVRLTHMLHSQYCSNRAYYAASTLGGLTHADQRITEDVEKFSFSIAELYSYTFKVSDHWSKRCLGKLTATWAYCTGAIRPCQLAPTRVTEVESKRALVLIRTSTAALTDIIGLV